MKFKSYRYPYTIDIAGFIKDEEYNVYVNLDCGAYWDGTNRDQ